MPTLVRSWNLFHGNTAPPDGATHLEEMVALVTADAPALLCLQEVPPSALPLLAEWSGMACHGVVARAPSLGPLSIPVALGARLTRLAPARLRSLCSGQANAVLVRRDLAVLDSETLALNPPDFVRSTAALIGVDRIATLAWAKEPRVAQALRLRLPDGRALRLVHLHATSFPSDPAVPDAEVARAAGWLRALAATGEIAVLAGDLNVPPGASPALQALAAAGFSAPADWIDQVLVRGAAAAAPLAWEPDRRARDGRLLSDHAPVEVTIA
jgi:endonuclease/exonuclease/phosphatase family metal-dependent hydrolase